MKLSLRILALVLTVLATACGSHPSDGASNTSDDELRQLREGIDINEALVDLVPASAGAPASLAAVKSWSVRYVELRDPQDPKSPDPADPFVGFFLVANDASDAPLFFDAMALTDGGVAHF